MPARMTAREPSTRASSTDERHWRALARRRGALRRTVARRTRRAGRATLLNPCAVKEPAIIRSMGSSTPSGRRGTPFAAARRRSEPPRRGRRDKLEPQPFRGVLSETPPRSDLRVRAAPPRTPASVVVAVLVAPGRPVTLSTRDWDELSRFDRRDDPGRNARRAGLRRCHVGARVSPRSAPERGTAKSGSESDWRPVFLPARWNRATARQQAVARVTTCRTPRAGLRPRPHDAAALENERIEPSRAGGAR